MRIFLLSLAFILGTPFYFAFASVSITEIMYDPEGTDANAGGEWIEIHNGGAVPINLTAWFFFEDGTNHSITTDGATEVPPGGYAVIARDLTAFRNFFSGFSGLLFRASFSLNDGEALAMKSAKDAVPSDEVTYTSEWGGKNDGNSLQKSGGSFIAALPTPGSTTAGGSSGSDTAEPSIATTSPSAGSSTGSAFPVEPQVFADAGPDRTTVIGADVAFEAKAWGLQWKPLENARFIWNFGDGTVKEGKKTAHAYRYAGEYIVTLDVASGYFAGSDRVKVSVENSAVLISSLGSGTKRFVELKNGSGRELDISGWALAEGGVSFFLPERTFIGGNQKLIFPKEVTGMPAGNDVSLLYPNGSVADRSTPGRFAAAPKAVGNPQAMAAVVEKASTASANVAAAAAAPAPEGEGMPSVYKWLGGAIMLALAAAFGASRFPRPAPKQGELSADDFAIFEEK